MTRKDYRIIAAALAKAKPFSQENSERMGTWRSACHYLCDALKDDNARFDMLTFLSACRHRSIDLIDTIDTGDIGQYDSNGSA